MLKLWGRTNSINVQKVRWTLAEIGLPCERVDAGLSFGGVNEPWYRAMNPNGRVPTIDDDGFVLWESNSIVRYLASKHGAGTLLPDNLQTRADADRWTVGCFAQRWLALPIPHAEHPNLLRWLERLAERPGFLAHVKQSVLT